VDGVSMNRSPDGAPQASAYVLHTALASAKSSPGTHADGSPFGGSGQGDGGTDGGGGGPVHLRIAAANLSPGTHQKDDGVQGIRIVQALHPDVAMMQEMNFTGDARSLVDAAFGPEFSFFRQDGVSIPNGVVSRFPIVASGVWDDPSAPDRDFV